MLKKLLLLTLIGAGVYGYLNYAKLNLSWLPKKPKFEWNRTEVTAEGRFTGGDATLKDAFENRKRKVDVNGSGRVIAILPDDRLGDHHQKFIVLLKSGQSLQISHNIDIAPRVPVKSGDQIDFSGVYDYNSKGGVVHWTHHDPKKKSRGGWIKHQGRTYQ